MIIAFTGAGISKASGIPTFEDMEKNMKSSEIGIRDMLTRSWANSHKEKYNNLIAKMKEDFEKAKPNDAHIALAEYNIPIITMNIDGLHEKAGSKKVLPIHGTIPDLVLYEDPAPNYKKAIELVETLGPDDLFLIIGTSFYTSISEILRAVAITTGARVFIINNKAEENVRAFIENNKEYL